jgi:hypothetical protein
VQVFSLEEAVKCKGQKGKELKCECQKLMAEWLTDRQGIYYRAQHQRCGALIITSNKDILVAITSNKNTLVA